MSRLVHALVLPLLLAAVVAAWLRSQPLSSSDSGFVMEMQLVSPASGPAWLRFNTGEGWNFRDTRIFSLTEGAESRTYRVPLPEGAFRLFRILPPNASVGQALIRARLLDASGAAVAEGSPARYDPAINAIQFALDRPLRLTAATSRTWAESALEFALLTAAFALLGALFKGRAASAQIVLRTWGQRLWKWAHEHPRATLLVVAVLGVAASCHPVVFFGKSFISPNNGALCLYDVEPTIAGAPPGPIEPWNGSDVNALPWQHLPYSTITHEAVFRDAELPLWNRYAMCGLTLLGQGMSMPGDPLFWITVAADGASWSWDLRFLLAKFLFALGIGFVVLTAVRHLPTAVLLAFSSAFIGFFSFRFNHPAFFSVCYAPWILLCWLRAAEAAKLRAAGGWALCLIGANWLEFNSGVAKEMSMLMLGMNGIGALVLLLNGERWAARWRKLAMMVAGCVAFLAISAPQWVVFLDALRLGSTIYDAPRTGQLSPGLLLGVFDDLFWRQLMANEWHCGPSVNFLVLLGILWKVADAGRIFADRVARALLLGSLPALAMIFGVVPPAWIDRMPFLKSISHVDNTFICVLIIPLFVLAGFGLRSCLDGLRTGRRWQTHWKWTLVLFGGLVALYLGTVHARARWEEFALQFTRPTVLSSFFSAYAMALFAAVILFPHLARRLALGRGFASVNLLGLGLCFVVLHFRHGMWLETKFDTYVMNPQARVNLRANSAAVDFIRARQAQPARTMGFGQILRPGFNSVLELEGPAGVDAVSLPALAEWYEMSELGGIAMWWPTASKANLASIKPFYDALNVRYYLGSAAGSYSPAAGLKNLLSADLEVYESESAWPRAFFADRVARYDRLPTLIDWVKGGDGRPFAAVLRNEAHVPELSADQGSREIVAARDYRLTSNTTSFTIDAPRAGLAVLSESFVPDNFRARLNGREVPIFRVNHVFKGVALPEAGAHQLQFEYWPRPLTVSLWVALGGFVLIAAGGLIWWWIPHRAGGI